MAADRKRTSFSVSYVCQRETPHGGNPCTTTTTTMNLDLEAD